MKIPQFSKYAKLTQKLGVGQIVFRATNKLIASSPLASTCSRARALSSLGNHAAAEKSWATLGWSAYSPADFATRIVGLLKLQDWQTARRVGDEARSRGRASLELELGLAEAAWRLDDELGRKEAIRHALLKLKNPSAAEIAFVKNLEFPPLAFARLKVLQSVEKMLPEILQIASDYETSPVPADWQPNAFVFWNSGLKSSPQMVQRCFEQAQRQLGTERLNFLDDQTLPKWVNVPKPFDRVKQLWPAHYSDILRVSLLARNGGIWLDSTIWTTEDVLAKFDDYVPGKFFAFAYNETRISSWFLMARPDSRIPKLMLAALEAHWRKAKRLDNYFLFHDIFEALLLLDADFKAEWSQVPFRNASDANRLGRYFLWQNFDEAKYSDSLARSPIQKLTYKFKNRPVGPETLAGKILAGELS